MRRFVYNNDGVFTGRVLNVTKYDTFPAKSTEVPPPPLQAGEYARFNGTNWDIITELPERRVAAPTEASKAKIRIALKRAGKLPALAAYINSLGANSEERILLEEDPTIKRGGTISNLIRDQLSLTEEQMDQLFTVANTII